MVCGSNDVHPSPERVTMIERSRDEAVDRGREASSLNDREKREQEDDLSRRRLQGDERQPLTPRERDERWPIG